MVEIVDKSKSESQSAEILAAPTLREQCAQVIHDLTNDRPIPTELRAIIATADQDQGIYERHQIAALKSDAPLTLHEDERFLNLQAEAPFIAEIVDLYISGVSQVLQNFPYNSFKAAYFKGKLPSSQTEDLMSPTRLIDLACSTEPLTNAPEAIQKLHQQVVLHGDIVTDSNRYFARFSAQVFLSSRISELAVKEKLGLAPIQKDFEYIANENLKAEREGRRSRFTALASRSSRSENSIMGFESEASLQSIEELLKSSGLRSARYNEGCKEIASHEVEFIASLKDFTNRFPNDSKYFEAGGKVSERLTTSQPGATDPLQILTNNEVKSIADALYLMAENDGNLNALVGMLAIDDFRSLVHSTLRVGRKLTALDHKRKDNSELLLPNSNLSDLAISEELSIQTLTHDGTSAGLKLTLHAATTRSQYLLAGSENAGAIYKKYGNSLKNYADDGLIPVGLKDAYTVIANDVNRLLSVEISLAREILNSPVIGMNGDVREELVAIVSQFTSPREYGKALNEDQEALLRKVLDFRETFLFLSPALNVGPDGTPIREIPNETYSEIMSKLSEARVFQVVSADKDGVSHVQVTKISPKSIEPRQFGPFTYVNKLSLLGVDAGTSKKYIHANSIESVEWFEVASRDGVLEFSEIEATNSWRNVDRSDTKSILSHPGAYITHDLYQRIRATDPALKDKIPEYPETS